MFRNSRPTRKYIEHYWPQTTLPQPERLLLFDIVSEAVWLRETSNLHVRASSQIFGMFGNKGNLNGTRTNSP